MEPLRPQDGYETWLTSFSLCGHAAQPRLDRIREVSANATTVTEHEESMRLQGLRV